MAFMGRTRAVAKKLVSDVERILFYTTIIVQIVFFIFYGYSIYKNISDIVFLIIYSLLTILSLTNFIYYLATYNKSGKGINRFKRFLRVFKYMVNGTMLIVNVVEMINFGVTDFNKILLIVSAVSLFAQVIIEFIRIFVERYVELFTASVQMDLQFISKLGKIKEVKGNIFEIIDAPLEAIANKLEGRKVEEPNLSKTQEYVNQLADEYESEQKEAKIKKKIAKKVSVKQKSEENASKQKSEIKEHLGIIKNSIFKKKHNND